MAKKKNNKIPFHIAHKYKHWTLGDDGPKFWAKDKFSAELYCKKIKWSPLGLKEFK